MRGTVHTHDPFPDGPKAHLHHEVRGVGVCVGGGRLMCLDERSHRARDSISRRAKTHLREEVPKGWVGVPGSEWTPPQEGSSRRAKTHLVGASPAAPAPRR